MGWIDGSALVSNFDIWLDCFLGCKPRDAECRMVLVRWSISERNGVAWRAHTCSAKFPAERSLNPESSCSAIAPLHPSVTDVPAHQKGPRLPCGRVELDRLIRKKDVLLLKLFKIWRYCTMEPKLAKQNCCAKVITCRG